MTRRSVAKVRSEIFGGHWSEQMWAAGRTGALDIDECSAEQLALRVQLAFSLLGPGQGWGHRAMSYNFSVLPAYDNLVITSDAPGNLANSLIGPGPSDGVPGIRLDHRGDDYMVLVYVPTGGRITIPAAYGGVMLADKHTNQSPNPLGGFELQATERALATPDDAKVLLAAIISRLSAYVPPISETRRWSSGSACGNLFQYFRKDAPLRSHLDHPGFLDGLVLSGGPLKWWLANVDGHQLPRIETIMTGPVVGLRGCTADRNEDSLLLHYRSASVQLAAFWDTSS